MFGSSGGVRSLSLTKVGKLIKISTDIIKNVSGFDVRRYRRRWNFFWGAGGNLTPSALNRHEPLE